MLMLKIITGRCSLFACANNAARQDTVPTSVERMIEVEVVPKASAYQSDFPDVQLTRPPLERK